MLNVYKTKYKQERFAINSVSPIEIPIVPDGAASLYQFDFSRL